MKLLVTGGTGFLGRAVVRSVLGRGHNVRAMVRDGRVRPIEGAELVEATFDDTQALEAMLSGIDAVLHLAGKVSRDPKDAAEMHWIHVEATQKLLNAMERSGVRRLILASTSGTIAVSSTPRPDATERDEAPLELLGRWPYYLSKRLQEEEVLRRNARGSIEAVILNPSLLLGPGDERLSSTTDVLNILNGRVPAITPGSAAIVDVRDCAEAFAEAIAHGRAGERYLLNGANMSIRSFVERVAHAGGVSPPRLRLPGRWALAGAKVLDGLCHATGRTPAVDIASVDIAAHYWNCDASKAKEELRFTARDPQTTLRDLVLDLEHRGLFRRR
ncbi:MAG: NAD-dependent epimerase/dehydratase family protein [Deltaproteobacteria bacterium]|nr:NAD-dependent epimerase/dehydratase family protein [Deltaproteobacteria bacterium]